MPIGWPVASLAYPAQTNAQGDHPKMQRSSELFAISAIILLLFALVARFISPPGLGISLPWRGTGYVFPPAAACIAQATALCFFASVYSFYMLPFSRTAALWHFWLTDAGIALFWASFYRVVPSLADSRTALLTLFVSPLIALLAQLIFIWNVVQAITKMPRLHG